MANTADLKPFRSYDEHDVVNLFALDDPSVDLNVDDVKIKKGILVSAAGNGWKNTDEALDSHGLGGAASTSAPGKSFANTVSLRYGTTARVQPTASGVAPLGITLWDMAERDENGEKLLYHPRKAAEMQAVISGQTMPVLTKGVVLYKGQLTDVAVSAGVNVYNSVSGKGELSIDSLGATKVGKTLGAKDDQGYVLLKVEL
jgi:alkylation response protein AidB-like acyl-CoA dehydrogenase